MFLLKDGTNYTVYTGINNVPTMEDSNTAGSELEYRVIMNKAGDAIDMVVVTNGAPSGDDKSVYILSDSVTTTKNAAGDNVYTVPALVDGVYTDLILDGYNTGNTIDKGLHSVGVVSSNTVKAADVRSGAQDATALTSYVGNVLDVGGNVLTVTSDTKFIIITGTTSDKVFEGTADDLVYDTEIPANNSRVAMSAAGTTGSDQYIAGYVYIVR